MNAETKRWPAQLRTVERTWANDKADYQPPTMHVGMDGSGVTTLTLHDQAGNHVDGHPIAQISLVGDDSSRNLERTLLTALDAVQADRIAR